MFGPDDDPDPEAVLERREQRVSRRGHAAAAGALAATACSLAALVGLVGAGVVTTRGLYPAFSLAGIGALAGAWLHGTLLERAGRPADGDRERVNPGTVAARRFRRALGAALVLALAAGASGALAGGLATESGRLLAILAGVAWLAGAAVTWRFR